MHDGDGGGAASAGAAANSGNRHDGATQRAVEENRNVALPSLWPLLDHGKSRLARLVCQRARASRVHPDLKDLDLQVRGRPATDPDERAHVFGEIVPGLDWAGSLESWIAGSPLVEMEFG